MSTSGRPSGSASMVRLTATSPAAGTPETGNPPVTGSTATTTVVTSTQAQKAGYSRATREAANPRTVRPQALIRITNPLIRKKTSTPRKP